MHLVHDLMCRVSWVTDTAGPTGMQVEGMPLTDVLLVNIKLLTLPELKLITDHGADGRKQLSDAFSGASRLVSSMHRKSQTEPA